MRSVLCVMCCMVWPLRCSPCLTFLHVHSCLRDMCYTLPYIAFPRVLSACKAFLMLRTVRNLLRVVLDVVARVLPMLPMNNRVHLPSSSMLLHLQLAPSTLPPTKLTELPRVFPAAHMDNVLQPCALFVSGETTILSLSVQPIVSGTTLSPRSASVFTCNYSRAAQTSLSASIGNKEQAAQRILTTNIISVPAASHTPMEPSTALALRHLLPVCPYNADIWESLLQKHGLLARYDKIVAGFRSGFDLHLLQLFTSQTPPNHPSLTQHRAAFDSIIERELATGHYVGPFTRSRLHSLLGDFQTSPVSIIPKSGKPGKYRVIQIFSFPYSPSPATPSFSINSRVDSDDFP